MAFAEDADPGDGEHEGHKDIIQLLRPHLTGVHGICNGVCKVQVPPSLQRA